MTRTLSRREEDHEKGFTFVNLTSLCIQRHSSAFYIFRGGPFVGTYIKGEEMDVISRNAGFQHDKPVHGFDGYLQYEGASKRVSLLTHYPWCQKQDPKCKRWRVTAFNPGLPTVKETEAYYKDIWFIMGCYADDGTDKEPYEIRAINSNEFIKLGYKVGYEFPNHKGRRCTIHFTTKFGVWEKDRQLIARVPGVKHPLEDGLPNMVEKQNLTVKELIEKIFLTE